MLVEPSSSTGSTVTGAICQASQVRDALAARYDVARTRPSDAVRAAQAQDAPNVASVPRPPAPIAAPLDLANLIGATAAPPPRQVRRPCKQRRLPPRWPA